MVEAPQVVTHRLHLATLPRDRVAAFFLGSAFALAVVPARAEAQFEGAWLPRAGTLTARLWLARQDNSEWFCGTDKSHCRPGERAVASELTEREQSNTSSGGIHLEGAVTDWLALGVDVPFHTISYARYIPGRQDPVDDLDTQGIGDVSASARIGSVYGPWGFSGGYRIGLPTGDFSISAFLVPVGQGSPAHDFFLELGRSFHPAPAYLEVGVLYRIREGSWNSS